MFQSLFPRDVFAELDRLQREMRESFDLSPSIRGLGRGGFPALNVGGTPQSVEIFAFAPGLDRGHIVRPSVGPTVEHVSVRRKESGW